MYINGRHVGLNRILKPQAGKVYSWRSCFLCKKEFRLELDPNKVGAKNPICPTCFGDILADGLELGMPSPRR